MLRPNSLAPSAPARFVRRCGALAALLAALAVTAHAALAPAPAPLTERLSTAAGGAQSDGDSTQADVTPDGRYVAFISEASNLVPGDTNDVADVFVRDRAAGTTERISIATDGTEGDGRCDFTPAISDNGRFIAFASFADNLVADDTNGVFDTRVTKLRNTLAQHCAPLYKMQFKRDFTVAAAVAVAKWRALALHHFLVTLPSASSFSMLGSTFG